MGNFDHYSPMSILYSFYLVCLDVIKAAVGMSLNPEGGKVELDSLSHSGVNRPRAVSVVRVVARVSRRYNGAMARA